MPEKNAKINTATRKNFQEEVKQTLEENPAVQSQSPIRVEISEYDAKMNRVRT